MLFGFAGQLMVNVDAMARRKKVDPTKRRDTSSDRREHLARHATNARGHRATETLA